MSADVEAEAAAVAGLEPGDLVDVEDRNDETHRAVVAQLSGERADQCFVEKHGRSISLVDYWRPIRIGPEEPVISVRFVKGVDYDGAPLTFSQRVVEYPASRVALPDGGWLL